MPPILVGRAADAPSEALVTRLVEAARRRGYEANPVQPDQGRFAVRARYVDAQGAYTMTIECFLDGHVLIRPVGPRVQRRRAVWLLPRPLKDEMLELAGVLGQAARGG